MSAQAMYALQQIDTALDAVRNRRTRLPELARRAEALASLNARRAAIVEAEQKVATAQAAIEGLEHEATTLTTKRTRLEAQLKTIIAPREAEALMHEIALINAKRGELDDRELEAMDEQASGEQTIADVMAFLPTLEANLLAAEEALAAAQAALDAEEAQHRIDREAAAAELSADEAARYERARQQFDGVGIAKLDGVRCTGCHLDVSRGEVDAMRALPADVLAECPQCGRYLVR